MKTEKQCTLCKETKDINNFTKLKVKGRNGKEYTTYRGRCNSCQAEKNRGYYNKNPDKRKEMHRKARYSIASNQFIEMLIEQNYSCAICPRPIENDTAMIDHDHSCCPGRETCGDCVRGLLCRNCNTMIGLAGDSPEILRLAADWLESISKE